MSNFSGILAKFITRYFLSPPKANSLLTVVMGYTEIPINDSFIAFPITHFPMIEVPVFFVDWPVYWKAY